MKSLNLFGEMQEIIETRKLGKIQQIKKLNGFRLAANKTVDFALT